jgi:cephalosporin hydroxylase
MGVGDGSSGAVTDVVAEFHRLYHAAKTRTWANTFWLGYLVRKCPLDLWVYQEILTETRPDIVVETGTASGGSALFFASMFDLLDSGRVVTVDVAHNPDRPRHDRIVYLHGSSTDHAILDAVRDEIPPGTRVMVVLDADHRKAHVLTELRAYGELVTPGNYLIVEDTNSHLVRPEFGPGPIDAVDEFLSETDTFEIDRGREKFFMTFNPRGYLRRRG